MCGYVERSTGGFRVTRQPADSLFEQPWGGESVYDSKYDSNLSLLSVNQGIGRLKPVPIGDTAVELEPIE